MCPDEMIRRCIYGAETRKILNKCHHGPAGGHYGPSTTAKKVFDAGFYWPTILKEAHSLVPKCDALAPSKFLVSLSQRVEMPLKKMCLKQHPYEKGKERRRRKLDAGSLLWAFHTAYKKPIGTTPYREEKGDLRNLDPEKIRINVRRDQSYLVFVSKVQFKAPKLISKWIQKEFKAEDKVLLYKSKYKFKVPILRSKWYGPFMVKHGFLSSYVELYDKHGESFILNGHRVKLYHDEEQINKQTTKEIHLMLEEGKMEAIPFMAPFPADYHETMPWVAKKRSYTA
ncbi:hypothetical protein Tco_0487550 [Tanacetum coccineum]